MNASIERNNNHQLTTIYISATIFRFVSSFVLLFSAQIQIVCSRILLHLFFQPDLLSISTIVGAS
ncbi:hypothetical protein T12_3468 [Trichinella patagoniensis]|uniref:Uncharacterized protein n=1 Tax=Trichinella patagoniensis TaxID=990121 RepID=A0A0V1ABT8_9BILA|nr:hypothetical protein T12_3468 [Trichinella patagoniensis]